MAEIENAEARIEALRALGAERVDPVGFRFIEALARRAAAAPAHARQRLDNRLAEALTDLTERLARAKHEPRAAPARGGGTLLAELLALIGQPAPQVPTGEPAPATVMPGELKSAKAFRRTWSRLRVDQQLSQALAQAPENAGPLNSHSVVLRSLRLMREISPEYLERFTGYVDALLWLEQAGGGGGTAQKKAGRSERAGKLNKDRNKAS